MRKLIAIFATSVVFCLTFGTSAAIADGGAEVLADEGWQPVTYVEKGQSVQILAEGEWTVDDRNWRYVGPEGYRKKLDRKIWQGCKVSDAYPYGRLIARVGYHGPVFSVGEARHLIPRKSGVLFVRINDEDRCLGDNAGSVDVSVSTYSKGNQ